MSLHTEKSNSTTPNAATAPRTTSMSASSYQTSPPPAYEDSKGFTSRPLSVNTTPREFMSTARQKEAMSTTSTSSSSTRGPLSLFEQIREHCEPFARAIMGTPQLDDHTTAASSTSVELKEIKSLLQSLIIDVETLKEQGTAQPELVEPEDREPLSATVSTAMRFAGHVRPLDSRIYVQITTATKVLHMLYQPVGGYIHLMKSNTTTMEVANTEEDRFLQDIQAWRDSWLTGLTWTAYTVWTPPTTLSSLPYTHIRPCRCIPVLLRGNERHGDQKTCFTRRLGQETLLAVLHHLVYEEGTLMPLSLKLTWDTNQAAAPYLQLTE
ncbi:hypothetical protein CRE_13744 [Caenorhabditis remanei]|uniref:Uncharacterized protein n=1 Tax=Caenorhabditis remanei TaxID=31234 RepID=E3NH60_CAERE|nr:hypothetical protein CRE_13744 [Caenorhabditis remanei]